MTFVFDPEDKSNTLYTEAEEVFKNISCKTCRWNSEILANNGCWAYRLYYSKFEREKLCSNFSYWEPKMVAGMTVYTDITYAGTNHYFDGAANARIKSINIGDEADNTISSLAPKSITIEHIKGFCDDVPENRIVSIYIQAARKYTIYKQLFDNLRNKAAWSKENKSESQSCIASKKELDLKKKVSEAEAKYSKAVDTLTTLQSSEKNLTNEIRELKTTNTHKSKHIKEKLSEISDLKTENTNLTNTITLLNSEISRNKQCIDMLEKTLAVTQKGIDIANSLPTQKNPHDILSLPTIGNVGNVFVSSQAGSAVLTSIKQLIRTSDLLPTSVKKLLLDNAFSDLLIGILLKTIICKTTDNETAINTANNALLVAVFRSSEQMNFVNALINSLNKMEQP